MYDVTDFVSSHPGGDKILLAAGGSLEPYFALYGVHKTKEVMEMVEVSGYHMLCCVSGADKSHKSTRINFLSIG